MGGGGGCAKHNGLSVSYSAQRRFLFIFLLYSFWDDTKEEKITPFLPSNWK